MRPTTPALVAFLLLVACGISSCGGVRHTVHEGGFQKRKHQPGWHLDLGGRSGHRVTERATGTKPLRARVTTAPMTTSTEAAPRTGPEWTSPSVTNDLSLHSTEPTASLIVVETGSHTEAAYPSPDLAADQEPPAKHFNPWALPAFALALGTIAYGILGTSNIVIVIAVVLTLLVASIALKKGRTNEWTGKGFAVSAMIIGCLSALITVMALLQGGF